MSKTGQKWLSGCMALAFAATTLFSPALAIASMDSTTEGALRLSGENRYETAAKIAQQGWESSDYAVLAAGMDANLVDALTAAPLAKEKNAPILLTEGKALNTYARQELARLNAKTVYITSGSGVIQKSVLDELAGMGITVKSVGGKDRFETALNIAKELPGKNELVVTTAWKNADALSVASIAAAKGMPILLTDSENLNADVKAYIDSIKAKVAKTYVIGGSGAVSDNVKSMFPNAARIGGATRYETGQEIIKAFIGDLKPGQVFVANGNDNHLVDSLAGSPYAALSKSPIVLIDGTLNDQTKNFVKLNLLPNKLIVLGGEKVVGSNVLTALGSAAVYAEDNAVKGSSDAANLDVVSDVVKINADNVTVKNTKVNYSVSIQGNNATLDNVTVAGTVFIDPGSTGTATLNGVKADKIVVVSGGKDSIHISNSTAGTLIVSSDTQTRVEASGTTNIGSTLVTSYAILDANGGKLGEVLIVTEPGKDAIVELRGTFTEPVVVEGQVTLKAAANAVVPSVVIATKDAAEKVTLDGSFKTVEITRQANVSLADNAIVESMETKADATIIVPPTAKIDKLEAGNTATKVGGGGKVNNQTTPTTPTAPPTTSTTPPPAGGGGPVGGGGTQTQLSVTSVGILGDITQTETNTGSNSFSFDLSGENDTKRITALKIAANEASPELVITSIKSRDVNWLEFGKSIKATVSADGTVAMDTLMGGLDTNNDGVSLGAFRMAFGADSVVITGKLQKSGFTDSSTITVTIDLGVNLNTSRIENQWMVIEKEAPKLVKVTIKPGQGTVTLGTITQGGNFNFAQVVAALAIDEINYTGGALSAEQLKALIGIASNEAFNAVKLSQLVNKTITFGGAGNNEYTVTFVQG
ncbi:hypothetical protein AT727_02585 [Desulfitobacterium hafniense]|uniref:Cell wall-binding protein n=1 Tax=Desulfitobacterium hafniense TaxID=49338 RepID=A0A0W1JQ46_DESHA|nr:cell wall-binding repeat-containing protein [Desulfitobacterium hafniense]KTE93860.1 hypothetical protein AT727_02585 [Desulfitobacterium hafniense]